ncbi:EndoU domain-containing protein, partial [Listeria immobilis]
SKGFKFVYEGIEDANKIHKKADKVKEAKKSTKKASGAKVKIEIPKERLEHANLGDFTKNPKTGAISKMKGGGHGQDNIDFLRKQNIEVNIEKTYSNGVRVGNVPEHKTKSKQKGSNQSWFPKNWTAADIENAGQQIARLPEFAKVNDGEVIFGEVNGVRVGVIKTNGKIGTIFPDATRQP